MSGARKQLQKAHFFLARAEQASITDREPFLYYLEASVVFARSVVDHLRKEYTDRDRAWCRPYLDALEAEPLVNFFVHTRNVILHLREVDIGLTFEVQPGTGGLIFSGHAGAVFISGLPWYKRSPRQLCEDFLRVALGPLRELRERRREKRRVAALRREMQKPGRTTVTLHFVSDDSSINDVPAPELVRAFLVRLEPAIAAFEERFQ